MLLLAVKGSLQCECWRMAASLIIESGLCHKYLKVDRYLTLAVDAFIGVPAHEWKMEVIWLREVKEDKSRPRLR